MGELFTRITTKLTSLLRGEIELIKTQLKEKVSRFAMAIALFAVAGVLALYGLGWLFFAAYAGIAVALPAWLAALIVGGGLLLIVGLLALLGKGQITKANATQIKAGENVKLDLEAVKEGVSR
ncbi:phage holin family protein [Pseudactinotalea sp. HY158]|uniref:phage holin family protein n=1 Tax=Pseudactinotalea sp. HY158 TaxID=2654547 RepID=UPI00189205E4|nr:phage holin family protein [Pseudactinotalea sp. HY158]